MHKQVDFMAEYKKRMDELQSGPYTPPSKRDWHRMALSIALVNAQESQYAKVKNNERWNQLEHDFYPALCEIAKTQGGHAELNINEETLNGQLIYIGEGLTLGSADPTGLTVFSSIVAATEDIFISTHGGSFKFQFFFCLHDKVFVEDHSEQIAEIEEKIQVHRLETMRLHQTFSDEN